MTLIGASLSIASLIAEQNDTEQCIIKQNNTQSNSIDEHIRQNGFFSAPLRIIPLNLVLPLSF